MYWRMYGGHNCTNYAAYRMVKAGLPNTRPWSGGGNATYWGTSMKSLTNATPRVGAVAWWKAGSTRQDLPGTWRTSRRSSPPPRSSCRWTAGG